jgi:predicted esterase
MSRPLWMTVAVLIGCLTCLSCQRAATPTEPRALGDLPPGQTPVPPLDLPAPPPLPATIDGQDLRQLDGREMQRQATLFAENREYERAAAYQYWIVQKTGSGRYDLACYLARLGRTDAAFYWLQRAGLDEGLSMCWVEKDEDLASLRADPRWEAVWRYLHDCLIYWNRIGTRRSTLVVPEGYDGRSPLTVILGLHGGGSNPEDFTQDCYQRIANELHVAFVCASGPRSWGKSIFLWEEEPESDYPRLQEALDEVKDRVRPRPGGLIAFGFGDGAVAGLRVAVRHPEEFAGAIVVFPPNLGEYLVREEVPSPLLARRRFVLVGGADEPAGDFGLATGAAELRRRTQAKVKHQPYPGVSERDWPPDFENRFPEWVRFIDSAVNH